MEVITIREYGALCVGEKNNEIKNGCRTLKQKTFDLLERFLLDGKQVNGFESSMLLRLSSKRGVGKIITARQYVGIIPLDDGTVIEILPKTFSGKEEDSDDGKAEARLLLAKMLTVLYNAPSKNLQTAKLEVKKMNILDVFIRMFVDEVTRLIKQGLKSSYETLEDNLTCFKGKIQFSQHIRHNFAHKERVYVAYDEFTVNRPENKILKSALLYLRFHAHSSNTKKDIKNLLSLFEEVEPSVNYEADFSKVALDRNTKAYSMALNMAEVFLKGKSFTSFSGSTASMALLFDMEKLFESYIPALLRRILAQKEATVRTQDKRHYLFDDPKRFLLKPDIVIEVKQKIFIMDTKWKRLNEDPNDKYGISENDMYQMYAYYQKYNGENKVHSVTLLYPKAKEFSEKLDFLKFADNTTSAKIFVHSIDLLKAEEDLDKLLDREEYEKIFD